MANDHEKVVITFDNTPFALTTDPAWRMRAVQLAVEKESIGQAMKLPKNHASHPREQIQAFLVVSANEPLDQYVYIRRLDQAVGCGCMAGIHAKPCNHAGAALLLYNQLAPPRVRSADGR